MFSDSHPLWNASPQDDANTSSCDVNSEPSLPTQPPPRFKFPQQYQPPQYPPPTNAACFAVPLSARTGHPNLQDSYLTANHPYLFLSSTSHGHHNPLTYPGAQSHHISGNARHVFQRNAGSVNHRALPSMPPAPSAAQDVSNGASDPSLESDFSTLKSNYLNMLSQAPVEESTSAQPSSIVPTSASVQLDASVQLEAEPEETATVQAAPAFRETSLYLMSPLDSPLPETPVVDMTSTGADVGVLTSPELADDGGTFRDSPLFQVDDAVNDRKGSNHTRANSFPDIPRPYTILLEPHTMSPFDASTSNSLCTSPHLLSSTRRRTVSATGTRKNVRPESLIPIDAPIQTRTYKTPSMTSRKEVPALFARKRTRSHAFGDDEDQLVDETGAVINPTEAERIEAKRKQNTIAARKSRHRKLEYIRDLEDRVEILSKERDDWRTRALMNEAVLKHHGLTIPKYSDL